MAAHTGVIWALAFSQHGRYLASGGADGVVRVWRVLADRGEQVGSSPVPSVVAVSQSSSSILPHVGVAGSREFSHMSLISIGVSIMSASASASSRAKTLRSLSVIDLVNGRLCMSCR